MLFEQLHKTVKLKCTTVNRLINLSGPKNSANLVLYFTHLLARKNYSQHHHTVAMSQMLVYLPH